MTFWGFVFLEFHISGIFAREIFGILLDGLTILID